MRDWIRIGANIIGLTSFGETAKLLLPIMLLNEKERFGRV
jgi:hypothetical protein